MLAKIAADYVARNGLRAQTIVKNCRRWDRLIGQMPNQDLIQEFRCIAIAAGLSPETIEKTITDIITACSSTGIQLNAGKRLKRKRPEPKPVPFETINAVWGLSPHWFRRWIVLAYWTGCRVEDSLRLYRVVTSKSEVLRLQAQKTGHNHTWPLQRWLKDWLPLPSEHPIHGASLWFTNVIRRGLTELCAQAGVDRVTPQQFRQRSITEWSRANATAGAIIHGCGLGVLHHYLDPLQILEGAAPRVRLPECFGASADAGTEDALLGNFRRCDPAAQSLLTGTAERLAAG